METGRFRMKNLQQEIYEDDNGRPFEAEKVACLAPYTHIADGFYTWTCGSCGEENSDRWYNISGRVMECHSCRKTNLLVRTNCAEINKLTWRNFEFEELKLQVARLKDIEKFNDDQLLKIKQEIMKLVEDAVRSHPTAEKHYPSIKKA